MFSYDKYKGTVDFLKERISDFKPEMLIVLGSGLGFLSEKCQEAVSINFSDIPNFKQSTVVGHSGKLTFGIFEGKKVIMMQGRMHMYEGNSPEQSAFAIGISHLLGVKTVILTNAAGGVNTAFNAGDIMLITDQINFFDTTPLYGMNCDELGDRFPDMSQAYNKELAQIAINVAEQEQIDLKQGVYFYMHGPQYETPAEIRAIRMLGGDAVGMSTVNEVIAANHCKMKVLGLSFITNMASGVTECPLSHEEVTTNAKLGSEKFSRLVSKIVAQ